MAYFIDILDIQLDLLGAGLLLLASWVFLNFSISYDKQKLSEINMDYGYFLVFLGIFALIFGFLGMFAWPLPSSYNLILVDPNVLHGIVLLALGFASLNKAPLFGILLGIAFISIPIIVYGDVILHFSLTSSPTAAAALYILIGIYGILSQLLQTKAKRYWSFTALISFVLSGILSYYIGLEAIFEHTAGWMKYTPWVWLMINNVY
ncbi:MAG: DUF981 family protein [Caldisphaera sp.]